MNLKRQQSLAVMAVFCLLNTSLSAAATGAISSPINPPVAGAADPLSIRKAFKLERDPLVSLVHQDESVEFILRGLAQKANLNLIFMVDEFATPTSSDPVSQSTAKAEEDPLLALEASAGQAATPALSQETGQVPAGIRIPFIELKNVPVSEAFALVLQMSGLTGRRVYNSILITTPEKMAKMGFSAPLIKTYRIYNQLPSKVILTATAPVGEVPPPVPTDGGIMSQLKAVFASRGVTPEPKMMMDPRTATLIIVGSQEAIDIADQLVPILDRPLPQVAVEIKLIELSKRGSEQLGVSYGAADGKIGGGFNNNSDLANLGPGNPLTGQGEGVVSFNSLERFTPNFTARLNALIRDNEARILTNPRLTIQHGVTGSFSSTSNFPILTTTTTATTAVQTISSLDIGERIDVTPYIDPEAKMITMYLNPQITTRGELVSIGAQAVPERNLRGVQTILRVKDGESIVIGGLMRKADIKSTSKIPLLGDIPLMGSLFSTKSSSVEDVEILIIVTPKIQQTE